MTAPAPKTQVATDSAGETPGQQNDDAASPARIVAWASCARRIRGYGWRINAHGQLDAGRLFFSCTSLIDR
jgi:hypothetical protein